MINKRDLIGKDIDTVTKAVYHDIDYSGITEFYWLSVPVSFDNVQHYIRFPYGSTLTIEHDNFGIVTKAY